MSVATKKATSIIIYGRDTLRLPPPVHGRAPPPLHTTPIGERGLEPMTMRCHCCLGAGHTQRYCPLKYCRLCEMYTHTARHCFRANNSDTKFRHANTSSAPKETGPKWRARAPAAPKTAAAPSTEAVKLRLRRELLLAACGGDGSDSDAEEKEGPYVLTRAGPVAASLVMARVDHAEDHADDQNE
jgi:hypothetical protein